eukprot:3658523-Amphidinium_carterae.1
MFLAMCVLLSFVLANFWGGGGAWCNFRFRLKQTFPGEEVAFQEIVFRCRYQCRNGFCFNGIEYGLRVHTSFSSVSKVGLTKLFPLSTSGVCLSIAEMPSGTLGPLHACHAAYCRAHAEVRCASGVCFFEYIIIDVILDQPHHQNKYIY